MLIIVIKHCRKHIFSGWQIEVRQSIPIYHNTMLKKYSLVAQMVKNLPEMQETQVQSLGWEDPLEKGLAAHSTIIAWRIPWTKEPGRLYSTWVCKELDTTEQLMLSLFNVIKQWQKDKWKFFYFYTIILNNI